MKNLRKLFCVACAVLFFTSCEETYNDKLFWPGEISQEYGSYIKPYTLDLTYSGEKLIGKTASFKTEDSETGTLTLNGIIPGEVTTPISRIKLNENGEKDAYTFSGTNITMGGVTVKYNGIITPKAMKLSLDVIMAHANNLAHTYAFPAYSHTTNEEATIRNSGASYVNITTKEGAESIAPIVLQMQQMATNILDVLFPYVLKNITLENDKIKYEMKKYEPTKIKLNDVFDMTTIPMIEASRIYDFTYIKKNYPNTLVQYPVGVKGNKEASMYWFMINKSTNLKNPYVLMVLPRIIDGKDENGQNEFTGKIKVQNKELGEIKGLELPRFKMTEKT